jgi:hypothetical protein
LYRFRTRRRVYSTDEVVDLRQGGQGALGRVWREAEGDRRCCRLCGHQVKAEG